MVWTDIFIKRPVLSIVVSLLILLIGLRAAMVLPIRQYPKLSNTVVNVTTSYPGASAELIQGFITTPIEQAVASAEGVDYMTSSSVLGTSTIQVYIKLNFDPNQALTEVLAKVNSVKYLIPKESNDPVVTKTTGQTTAVMYLGFSSEVLSGSAISDYLTRVVQPVLSTVDGVASADILGGQTFAMRLWLDPVRMAGRSVSPADVSAAIAANNFQAAAGQSKGYFIVSNVSANSDLRNLDQFKRMIIKSKDGGFVRVEDVATVELAAQSTDASVAFNGEHAIFIGVQATPQGNPLTLVKGVRALFPELERNLPPSMKMKVAYDSTAFIQSSINEVEKTLGEAVIIVVVVIFLFLASFRSVIIPVVTIPLSLIGVCSLMLIAGFSFNLLTLLAMVLAIGLVVDDAIVVVENIHRHLEEGKPPVQAAMQGAREIVSPVISMTITLAAVYAPIGFLGGLTGSLFREFAFTLAGSVVVSGIIALTLSPMMCSRLLKPPRAQAGGFPAFLDRVFDGLRQRYQRRLHKTLGFRALTILILAGVLALTGVMFASTPKELAPEEDQGIILALIKTPQYANLDYMEKATAQVEAAASDIREREHVFIINGSPSVHEGFGGLLLKPWGERKRNQKEIMEVLQPKLAKVTGAEILAFGRPSLPGSTGGPPVQFVIRTIGDYRQLVNVMAGIETAARDSGLFLFANSDLKFDMPQIDFKIDADKANRLGISMQAIGSSLATLLGGNYVNRFGLHGRSYEVIPQAPRDFRLTPDWLTRYQLRTSSGALVSLATVASLSTSVQPNGLPTFQQLNSATLQGVPFPGHTLGETIGFLQHKAKELLPDGYSVDYQGESRQFVQEGYTLIVTFVFALIVIFLVLAAQFESFRDPFIILIALPTSMFGALLPLNILGVAGAASMNIYSQIGLVTLIGLISKHGILMVEFANRLQVQEGFRRREAIEHAASVRLRPILMTTAAMVVGMVPLIVAEGAGAKSRFAIGIVIAAGMSVGTIFTLFVTPAIYTLIARNHGGKRGEEAFVLKVKDKQ